MVSPSRQGGEYPPACRWLPLLVDEMGGAVELKALYGESKVIFLLQPAANFVGCKIIPSREREKPSSLPPQSDFHSRLRHMIFQMRFNGFRTMTSAPADSPGLILPADTY